MKLFRQNLLLATLIFLSVGGIAQKNKDDSTTFFNPDNFFDDTLFFKSRFMECGEWGGHLELSKIYVRGEDFYITYQKYTVDCHSLKENDGDPSQTLVRTITKRLLNKDKLLIRRYHHQLIDAKLREPAPMHAGCIFEIYKLDKSINLSV